MTDVSPNFPTGTIANPDVSAAIAAESERTLFTTSDVRTSETYRWDTPSTTQRPLDPEPVAEAMSTTDGPEQLDIFSVPVTQEAPVDEVSVREAMLAVKALSDEIKARNRAAAIADGRTPTTADTESATSKTAAGIFLRAKHAASKRK